MNVNPYGGSRPIISSDQAIPDEMAAHNRPTKSGSPCDWFAPFSVTPLSKPMISSINPPGEMAASEMAPDPFADSYPSVDLQDQGRLTHDPDFYNRLGAPNPFFTTNSNDELIGGVVRGASKPMQHVQEVSIQGFVEEEHQSESKTLEE